jgi:small redox-active disulfide protein 2
MRIQLITTGCRKCVLLEKNLKNAMAALNISPEVEIIDDLERMIAYGDPIIPSLILDGQIVLSGKVSSVEEIVRLLALKSIP